MPIETYRGFTIEYRREIPRFEKYEVMHRLSHVGLFPTPEAARAIIDELMADES